MTAALWSLEEAPKLAAFFNRQVRTLPFSDPVDPSDFLSGIRWSQAPQLIDHDREQLAVASDGDQILGYAHVGASCSRDSSELHGLIRMLSYEPGQVAAGKAVLELAEQTLLAQGLRRVVAFRIWHGYRFYHAGRGFLVDRWTHVLGLLRSAGYQFEEDGVFLQADSLEGPEIGIPDSVPGADVTVTAGSGDRWLLVQLMRGDTALARCVGRPLSQHHSGDAARHGFMVEGLHVAEDLRGRGWGRYLLQRMHAELRSRGYRSAAIGTDASNGAALLLYGNAGYRIVCNEWTLTKDL